ncbi:hypothetical protein ACWEWX_31280 [Streptomyces asiaticus]
MKDRTRTRSVTTTGSPATPAPMPGRLPVDFDGPLGLDSKPLNDVPVGTYVDVTAKVTHARAVTGRVMLTLADLDGNTAIVTVDDKLFWSASRDAGGALTTARSVRVRGTVVRRIASMPATIDGRALWAVAR